MYKILLWISILIGLGFASAGGVIAGLFAFMIVYGIGWCILEMFRY